MVEHPFYSAVIHLGICAWRSPASTMPTVELYVPASGGLQAGHEALPIGVVVFPGSGVTDNLADKAKAMGIPLFDCRKAGGA